MVGNDQTRSFLEGEPTKMDFSMMKWPEEHLEFVRQKTAHSRPSPIFCVVAVANVFFVIIANLCSFQVPATSSIQGTFPKPMVAENTIQGTMVRFWCSGRMMKKMMTNGKKIAKKKNGTKRRRMSGKIGSRRSRDDNESCRYLNERFGETVLI